MGVAYKQFTFRLAYNARGPSPSPRFLCIASCTNDCARSAK